MATPLITAHELRLEYATKTVFDSLTIGVAEGDHIGIVGRNGDGKSSLLGMLAGTVKYQAGRVTRRTGLKIGLLAQGDNLDPENSAGQAVVGSRAEHEWAGNPKIRDIITGLMADIPWEVKVGELSGGQRRRVALAAVLIGDWDVIALDEPTNHLDLEGITWLAGHLRRRWPQNQGALLVVTHDRWFLDEVCTQTWEVHDSIVEPFEGGYAAYVLQRVERDRMRAVAEQKRQNLMRKELAWLRRGAPARTSKPKFRIEAANELIADVPPLRDSVQLQHVAMARLGKQVVDLENVSVSFGAQEVLRDITWKIGPGDRLGILGANGAGKSTLLALIAGELEPTSGQVKRGKTVKLGVLDQRFSQLQEIGGYRVREVLARHKTSFQIDGKEYSPAQLLERLGFRREALSQRVAELSGGQKRRLQILMLLLAEPNVIALDEPTNDVDSDTLAALEEMLDSWPGTLIVVSHDRYLLERVTDQQYAILAGTLRHLPGGVEEYVRLQAQSEKRLPAVFAAKTGTTPDGTAPSVPGSETGPATEPQLTGAQRHALAKEVAAIERKLNKTNQQIGRIEEKMLAHDQSDYQGLAELTQNMKELEAEATQLEEQWLEAAGKLE